MLGVLKAEYLRYFCGVDHRFKQLVLIVKQWANKRNINDPTNYTLNSFVFTLMVLNFLQRTSPPVLPTLEISGKQDIDPKLTKIPKDAGNQILFPLYKYKPIQLNSKEKDNDLKQNHLEDNQLKPNPHPNVYSPEKKPNERNSTIQSELKRIVPNVEAEGEVVGFERLNEQSIGELLIEFFRFYALQFDYNQMCISVRLGNIIPKSETLMSQTSTPQNFCVEDPFIIPENCARTCGSHALVRIRAEFNLAFNLLLETGNLQEILKVPNKKRQKELETWIVNDSKLKALNL